MSEYLSVLFNGACYGCYSIVNCSSVLVVCRGLSTGVNTRAELWLVNVGKRFTMYQVTPYAECMRGDLKHCELFSQNLSMAQEHQSRVVAHKRWQTVHNVSRYPSSMLNAFGVTWNLLNCFLKICQWERRASCEAHKCGQMGHIWSHSWTREGWLKT